VGGGGGVGGRGALLQPFNPGNMAAGGATDAQCGEVEGGGWRERERGDMQQITAHMYSFLKNRPG
jgi:hypothetical protein